MRVLRGSDKLDAMRRVLFRLVVTVMLLAALPSPAGAVFGGRPVDPGDPLARSVAAVLYRAADGAHLCTAVVLARRLVITAAHCTEGSRDDMRVIFSVGLRDVPLDRLRGVAAVRRPEPTAQSKGSYAYNNPDDIALVLLDAPAPSDALPARLADATAGAVRIAGYGAASELRDGGNRGPRQLGFGQGLRTAEASLSSKGAVLVAAQPGKAGMCTGDSGGPAFVAARDGMSVVGLLIGVSAPRGAADVCRGTAWFTSVPRWAGWIRTAARELGTPLP
ncbi:MAG TPA: trypsin-like serine protease [Devosia sp.]|nr:trypsin-like serine protease [Devosia sp.]